MVDDVPVTAAARTLCDLDGRVAERRLAELIDDTLVRRLTTLAELDAAYQALRGGRRSIRSVGRVLGERAPDSDLVQSRLESRILGWLQQAGLPDPVPQHPIGTYRVDLAYPDDLVFIECDGFDVHTTRTRFDGDRRRANELQLATGGVLLRYTWTSTREQVVREVGAALARRR